jgi:putative heme transporter
VRHEAARNEHHDPRTCDDKIRGPPRSRHGADDTSRSTVVTIESGDPTFADTDMEAAPKARPPAWRKYAGIVLSLGVIIAVFFYFLPKVADYGDVWETIKDMTPLEIATLLGVAIWNLISYQPAQMASLPGLTFGQSTISSQASTAVANTVPVGGAFGIGMNVAMYRSWGFKRRPITLSLLISGIWNNFAKLVLPVVALVLVVISGSPNGSVVVASVTGVIALAVFLVLFTAILRSEKAAFAIGEWGSNRVNWLRRRRDKAPISSFGHTLVKFRRETIDLVRHRWVALTVFTLISHLSLFLVLLVALRHVGVSQEEVSWQEALAAFSFIRLVSAIPLTPGGLGVVELGLTGGLVAAGGDDAQVVAAVLAYRALTYLPPIPIGAVCYWLWRRQLARRPSSEMATPAVAPT